MCKGLGKIEQRILEELSKDDNYPISTLISNIAGADTTISQKQSIWRAIRKLEKQGHIKTSKSVYWSDRPYGQHGGHSSCKVIRLVQGGNGKYAKNNLN